MGVIQRQAKPTLTAVELDQGDVLEFRLRSGQTVRLELVATGAEVIRTTLPKLQVEVNGARTEYRFHAIVRLNDRTVRLDREVGTQQSFYEPWEEADLRVWLDGVQDIFRFLNETHGACRPGKQARFAVQEATRRICPAPVHPWCPLPAGGLRIEDCYRGEDCWLGAYDGASAHGGLDINHPRGTPLWAPLDLDDHFYFHHIDRGHGNNRWRGICRWPDGAEWIIQAHHVLALTLPEHRSVRRGEMLALGAGTAVGVVDHSHFQFAVHDQGETVLLDPWILFWQMYRDHDRQKAVAE